MRRSLLAGDSWDVAPQLIGALLVVGECVGRIVEVEAYGGARDAASHAFRGPTARNAPMFGRAGTLYVYRSYGIHWCANVVTGRVGDPQAVLVRAVEPVSGLDAMWRRRPGITDERRLTDGPGKLCAALGIDGSHDGIDVCVRSSAVQLCVGEAPDAVVASRRIGISADVERPWRWSDPDSSMVSRPRARPGPRVEPVSSC